MEIDYETVIRYIKVNEKEPISVGKMLALFTLKNCQKLSHFLKKNKKGVKSKVLQNTINDPFVRPQFHDCL